MEKEPLPLGDWNRALSALDRDQPAEEPVEKSWDWDPETGVPKAESSAPAPDVVRSAAAIWAWVPDKAPVAPTPPPAPASARSHPISPTAASARSHPISPTPLSPASSPLSPTPTSPASSPLSPDVELVETPERTASRKQKRKRKRAAETAPEPTATPALTVAPAPVKSKAKRKTKPLAKQSPAPKPTPEPEVAGKRRRGRKNVPGWDALDIDPAPAPTEKAASGVAAAPTSRRRRYVKIGLLAALIAVCATIPWIAPQVPDLFAKVFPESTSTSARSDPTVEPLTSPPPTTVKPNPTLLGTRLESAGKPLELWVPRLNVRSEVVPISGQTGELIPPDDPQVLGWWQEGRYAGAAHGSVVITGHTVNGGGGAFDHLGELVPGDKIRVRTAAGTIRYVVQESRDVSVAKLARTAEEIFNQDGDGRLVLITCSDFNGEVYLSNSVVYATPIKDEPVDDSSPAFSPVERH